MNPMNRCLIRCGATVVAGLVSCGAAMLVGAQDLTPQAEPAVAPKPSVSRVVVRTLVDGTGTVKATQIRESSGNSRLDEEALQVVGKVWSFSPLKINGKGIEVWVNVPINFVQAETPAVPASPPASLPAAPVLPESVPPGMQPTNPAPEPSAGAVRTQPSVSDAVQTPASAPPSATIPAPTEAAASAAEAPDSAVTPTPAASAASAPR